MAVKAANRERALADEPSEAEQIAAVLQFVLDDIEIDTDDLAILALDLARDLVRAVLHAS